jgi:hypothetical protein
MEGMENLIGKDLKIIFDDGGNHISKREGKCIVISPTHVIIQNKENQMEGILLSKIIRFEVSDEN